MEDVKRYIVLTDSGEFIVEGNDVAALAEEPEVKQYLGDGMPALVYQLIGEFKFGGITLQKR